jgi:GT2 family glycosyltransferase
MGTERIAVLMTCHNRRDKTLACLDALTKQTSIDGIRMQVYLIDDGCTDGTVEAVQEKYPQVRVLHGNGNLYWCGGMRMAFAEAMKDDYDYYLWLNDDVILFENALCVLLKTSEQMRELDGKGGIIVGSCRDLETGEHTYGGYDSSEILITPGERPSPCYLINGNIVLIPRNVSKVVGNISPEFVHYGGDNDYGLRAIKAGFKLWVAPGYQGLCAANKHELWADPKVSLHQRWRYLHGPKGQPPYEVYIFARLHKGFLWPMDLVKLYLRVLFPGLYDKLKRLVKSPVKDKE